jgi:glycosyltransferase involved in cell wall biosynthesis
VACALADAVLTVHGPYKAQLAARGAEERRIAIVMNTPEESLIAGVKRSPGPPGDGEFTVAYHGTITRWYGVDLLVQAIGLLRTQGRRVRAVILGEGDQLETVRELAANLGVDDSISFSNRYLPIAEALRAVAGADCGIISNRPSEINRFILPNKLFEYVALGIPVVSARLETVAAHFDDEDLTFCRPGDPESLAGAIAWVMDERVAAIQKSVRAQARAELYRWDRSRIRYLDVLQDLQTERIGERV